MSELSSAANEILKLRGNDADVVEYIRANPDSVLKKP